MTAPIEQEFKLRATRPIETAAVDGVLRELGVAWRVEGPVSHTDVYLDDEHGSLRSAGIGLRLRTRNGQARLESKTAVEASDGLFVRREHAADWPATTTPRTANELPAALRDQVEPFVLQRPLQAIVQLATRRDVRRIGAHGDEPCELVVDEVVATAGDRHATFHEVEIEFGGDGADAQWLATALRTGLPLAVATSDKPNHAMAALGLAAPSDGPTAPDFGGAIADVVAHLTRHHLAALRAAEVEVRADGSPDALHRMRVASRRLRSVVRSFRDLWPDDVATRLLARLGDGSRELGAVRDLDVLIASLDDACANLPGALQAAGERFAAWVRGESSTARAVLQATLRSPDRLQRQAEVERDLAAIEHGSVHATAPATADAKRRIAHAAARLRKLLRALDSALPIGPLHELRIASKRLRYVAEQFAGLPEVDHGKALTRLGELQQATGEVCDHDAATTRLLEWLRPATANSPDGALTAAAIGALATWHALAAKKARKAAARSIARVDKKRLWRQLAGDERPDASLAH